MTVNPKAVRVLNKVLDAGFTEEKAIAAMTVDDILSMQGITVANSTFLLSWCRIDITLIRRHRMADITLINELQKSIKGNKVISFLGGGTE